MNDQDKVGRAAELFRQGDPDGAAAALEEHLEGAPDDVRAKLLLARCYSRMRMPEDAVEVLEDVLAQQPANAEALALRGAEHYFADELDEAEDRLKQALELEPGLVEAMVRLAQVHVDGKKIEDGEAVLQLAEDSAGSDADELAQVRMGRVYLAMQRRDADAALQLISDNAELWQGRPYISATVLSNEAILHARRRNYGRASELLIDALDLDPYFHMARGLLGQIALLQKDYELAVDQLGQVVENSEDVSPHAYYSLAASLAALKRHGEALPYYQAALDRGLRGFPALTARLAVAVPDLTTRYVLLAVFLVALAWLSLRVFSPVAALALVAGVAVIGWQIVRGGR